MSLSKRLSDLKTGSYGDPLAEFKAMPFEMMCNHQVDFGKAHLGKLYLNVWHQEQSWVRWVVKTYEGSMNLEPQKFMVFVELMVDMEEMEAHRAAAMEQQPIRVKPKPKARPAQQPNRMGRDVQRRHGRDDRSTAGSNGLPGECHDGGSEPHQQRAQVSEDAEANGHCTAGDMDHEDCTACNFTTQPHTFQVQFHQLVNELENELHQINMNTTKKSSKIKLLDVFCSPTSELTQQVNNLGHKAQRISLDLADLATVEGRHTLFRHLLSSEPESIWFSPTCGPWPWSSWSNFNGNRSIVPIGLGNRFAAPPVPIWPTPALGAAEKISTVCHTATW